MTQSRCVGFTLIEMLLVMAIAALMVSVVPSLISAALPGVQLKSAARSVAAALRQAHSQAITIGKDVALEVNLEQHKIQVAGNAKAVQIPETIDITLDTADQELADDKHGYIRFYADGTSTGGRVTLRHGDSGYKVDVDWLTGRIKLDVAGPR